MFNDACSVYFYVKYEMMIYIFCYTQPLQDTEPMVPVDSEQVVAGGLPSMTISVNSHKSRSNRKSGQNTILEQVRHHGYGIVFVGFEF